MCTVAVFKRDRATGRVSRWGLTTGIFIVKYVFKVGSW